MGWRTSGLGSNWIMPSCTAYQQVWAHNFLYVPSMDVASGVTEHLALPITLLGLLLYGFT